jgi:spermidine synthase
MSSVVDTSDPAHPLTYTGEVLASHTSDLQSWTVLKTETEGEILMIDNQFQSSKLDEHIYHETLVHSLFVGLKEPKTVLILGGAEGCTAREVFKWPTVKRVVQVDWDASLVAYFQTAGRSWNGDVYTDPRLEVYAQDALKWLNGCNESFDAVLIDLLDPRSDTDADFFKGLLKGCKSVLRVGGGIALNMGTCAPGKNSVGRSLLQWIRTEFLGYYVKRAALRAHVPSFVDPWGFALIVPNLWSSRILHAEVPNASLYFTKQILLDTLQWPKDYDVEWRTFWQEEREDVESPKKLTMTQPSEFAEDFGHYGC